MKTQNIIFAIVVLVSSQFLFPQITPINTISNGDYTVYQTNSYSQYNGLYEGQSYEVKTKISDINTRAEFRSNYSFSDDFFESTLSQNNYNTLHNNKSRASRFFIDYIIDQTGNTVYACALDFPTNMVTLSSSEIEAILTEAMSHKFDYTIKPNDDSSFYLKVRYTFIL